MHFAVEVICQPPIIVQTTQVRSAHVADLQLLVPTWPRRIRQSLKLPLRSLLLMLGRPHLVKLRARRRHRAGLPQNRHLQQPGIDRFAEVRNLLQQAVRLPYLIRCLLQSPLGTVDPSIALVDVFLHVAHVVILECPFRLVGLRGRVVFKFQVFRMDFGAWAKILFGVCEEVVGTGADEIGAADLWVLDGKLSIARGGASSHVLITHELLKQLSLLCCHDGQNKLLSGIGK